MNTLLSNERVKDVFPYFLLLVAYTVATSQTDAFFMGDTRIYARDISIAASIGDVFWDPGHPFWRPIGWSLLKINRHADPTRLLLGLNWVVGLVSIFLVYALSRRFSQRAWVPYLVSATFLFANPILNYVQTGQPYITGLMFLLIALNLVVHESYVDRFPITPLLAGLCLAFAVCIWIPYLFSLPAIALFPLIYLGVNRARLRSVLISIVVCAVVGAVVYGSMALLLRLQTFAELKAWIAAAGHGDLPDTYSKAIQRMIFTLARSVINMGEDGRLFKRFIVGDPFSPVSLFDLVRLSLGKLLLFYVFILAIIYNLTLSVSGRKTLILLSVTCIPFLVFAVFFFESGSIERYLPIFPVFVVAMAVSIGQKETRPWTKAIVLALLFLTLISNVGVMSVYVLRKQQDRVVARISPLQPLLRFPSRVVTVNEQDDLYAFNQNALFNPINFSVHEIDNLVTPNSLQSRRWQQIFAEKTIVMWQDGGDVWVTKRVLSQRPRAAWNWVEGDDPAVSWADINRYFTALEASEQTPGDDGFVKIADSEANRKRLQSFTQAAQATSP